MHYKLSLTLLILFSLAGCATPSQVAKESEDEYANQTIEDIFSCTTVEGVNDRLSKFITLSTQNCYKRVNGILKIVWDDQFIRAYVDKKTKQVIDVQIYSIIHNRSGSWASPYTANYLINDVLTTTDITKIDSNVDCTNMNIYGSCLYREDVGFNVSDKIFSEAEQLNSRGIRDFEYKINTRIGDARRLFNVIEIIGLKRGIDKIVATL